MEYRRLGKSGMKVSAISLGAWLTYGSERESFETADQCIRAAIEAGINYIDMADAYAGGKAEEIVGEIIKDFDRSKLVLSSKAYWPMSDDINDRGLSRKHLTDSVDKSLKRLGTDYLDIFFCHRYDAETPTEETVRTLNDLVTQGKILYWGTSMWQADQIEDAVQIAERRNAYAPVVEQPKYNMLDREIVEGNLEDVISEHGIGLVVFSPLSHGVLTGKYNDGIPKGSRIDKIDQDWIKDELADYRLDKVRKLTALANEMGVEMAALALAWILQHQNVDSVITGATKPEHVASNIKALEIDLTADVEEAIEGILQNKPYNSSRTITHPDELPVL